MTTTARFLLSVAACSLLLGTGVRADDLPVPAHGDRVQVAGYVEGGRPDVKRAAPGDGETSR